MKNIKIIVIILLFLLSCEKVKVNVNFDYVFFESMRKNWENQNIQSYSFKCIIGGPLASTINTYVVENNNVIKVIPDTSGQYPIDTTKAYTIETLIDRIESIYNDLFIAKYNNRTYCYYNKITVEYHPKYFFPNFCSLGYECRRMEITDMGWGFNILEFIVKEQ
jgi:hypothetical protein